MLSRLGRFNLHARHCLRRCHMLGKRGWCGQTVALRPCLPSGRQRLPRILDSKRALDLGSVPALRRYVVLVYRQPGPVNFVEAKLSLTKYMFDLEDWTGKLRLGDPVTATYFTCEYEPGCHAACVISTLCCAFCCWTAPSRDFHRRAKETGGDTGAAPARARRGGADASVHMA